MAKYEIRWKICAGIGEISRTRPYDISRGWQVRGGALQVLKIQYMLPAGFIYKRWWRYQLKKVFDNRPIICVEERCSHARTSIPIFRQR